MFLFRGSLWFRASQVSSGKESACNAGDLGSIPGLGRSPGERNGYSLQYSCPENSMDRGAWQAPAHGVEKSWTWLSDLTHTHTHTHTHTQTLLWFSHISLSALKLCLRAMTPAWVFSARGIGMPFSAPISQLCLLNADLSQPCSSITIHGTRVVLGSLI